MKTVRIIRGNYGWHPGGGRGVQVISQGETVQLSDAEADRIIEMQVGTPVETENTVKKAEPAAPVTVTDTEIVVDDGVVIPAKRRRK